MIKKVCDNDCALADTAQMSEHLKLGAVKMFFDLLPGLGDDTSIRALGAEVILRGVATLPPKDLIQLSDIFL